MKIDYRILPTGCDFTTEFPTYIIAFCPDTDEWYVTKQRYWFYEYPKEFSTYGTAIHYFEDNVNEFFDLRSSMADAIGFYRGHENEMYLRYYSSEMAKKFERK